MVRLLSAVTAALAVSAAMGGASAAVQVDNGQQQKHALGGNTELAARVQRYLSTIPSRSSAAVETSSSSSSSSVKSSSATLAVGSAQFSPVQGSTPSETAGLNAKAILAMAINTTDLYSNLELLTFPEFSQFGPNGPSGLCSSNPSELYQNLDGYCEDIPAAGAVIDCSSSTPNAYQIIACGLESYAAMNPSVRTLAVSYNTCQRNKGSNATNPSYYNSQVVVGGGRVLAVYPKFHPFYSSCFNTPPLELTTFSTMVSNVTFGMFTCFDILFADPKDDLVKKGVKYFSYSAAYPLVFSAAMKLFSGLHNVSVVGSNMDGDSSVFVNGASVAQNGGCPANSVGSLPCVAVAQLQL